MDATLDALDERAMQVASGLLDRSLPKAEWTHEAHVSSPPTPSAAPRRWSGGTGTR